METENKYIQERIKESEKYLDKIKGSLFGGAIGDALGYPIEFMSEKDIFDRYGTEGIQDYELDPIKHKALISDDTQMSLFTANGILYGQTRFCLRGIGGEPKMYMLKFYQDWLRTQQEPFGFKRKEGSYCPSWLLDIPELYSRRAPGNTCLASLRTVGENYFPEDESYINHPINNSKGCGGIMRIAPLGMANYIDISMDVLDLEAAELAAITHGHSLGYMSASVLAHIIHRIIYSKENKTLKEIVVEAKDKVNNLFKDDQHIEELTNIIDSAIEMSENDDSDLNSIHKLGEGWVAEETLGISLYCSLKYKDDFSKAITSAVNHGGDSDSTGAVTGNIVGACVGYEKIDNRWKNNLELSDIILELATDLCHGCQMSEYGSYTDKDWLKKYVR